MPRSSGIVAGLTAAALTVVAFLAYQASANVPHLLAETKTPPAAPSATGPAKPRKHLNPVPVASGSGKRVVYGLRERRVWLVGADGRSTRTFGVVPSTVSPEPGSYQVTSRTDRTPGSDGILIEHVVRFADVEGVVVGFSAPVKGPVTHPDPSLRTGGVRTTRPDGDALWSFATIGSKVVVVK